MDDVARKRMRNKQQTTVARQRPTRRWTGWKMAICAGTTSMAAHAKVGTTMRSDVFKSLVEL